VRVLIVGGGGREHALAWKLSQSPLLKELYCLPGNAGIACLAECPEIEIDNLPAIKKWSVEQSIDLVVVGPEVPLVAGLADELKAAGIRVFGPGRDGARLEGSKAWAKEMMLRWGIPTADFAVFDRYEHALRYLKQQSGRSVVVKANGLAAGKGVTVAHTAAEAEEALNAFMVDGIFGAAGEKVVIEEWLRGEELSVLAITDGKELIFLPSAQDHKAVGEGDWGPNTGGMGAYSPAPLYTPVLARQVEEKVFRPLLAGLQSLGIDYRGIIYAGLMVEEGEFKVLEFNARFGDPETQAILPRLRSDLLPLLLAAADGDLSGLKAEWSDEAAICVVLASGGYPGQYETGYPISGLDHCAPEKLAVFHAGTTFSHGNVVTAGGRVLGVTAWATNLSAAAEYAYQAVRKIQFQDSYYRRDIAYRALGRSEL
jgi:phosphoribosylamine--glycine ligase